MIVRRVRPLLIGLVSAALFATDVVAQKKTKYDYEFRGTQDVMYVRGNPNWDQLGQSTGVPERTLTIYFEHPGGGDVYRVLRKDLERTPAGVKLLNSIKSRGIPRSLDWALGSPDELLQLKRAITNTTELGPPNPNWKLTGKYATKEMLREYYPGGSNDDYKRGTFYFPTEGSPAAVDFMKNYQLHYGKNAKGEVILMHLSATTGQLVPLDTRGLHGDKPNKCLWVMDAEGNFYIMDMQWMDIYGLGYDGINHSTLSAGHPVAGAGQLEVHDGRIVSIDVESGHYRPTNKMLAQALDAFQDNGKMTLADFQGKVHFTATSKDDPRDHPGRRFIDLDTDGKRKVEQGGITQPDASDVDPEIKAPVDVTPPKSSLPSDDKLVHPEPPGPSGQLEVDRRAALEKPQAAPAEVHQPKERPGPEVYEAFRAKLDAVTDVSKIDAAFMADLYNSHEQASSVIGDILGESGNAARNAKMGEVRRQMDLEVWKAILKEKPLRVETTNQGKSNGARSDLDYTLYFVAEESGLSVQELIDLHTQKWKDIHKIDPGKLEIKVMNGDQFYPDWRSETLSSTEHMVEIRRIMGELRGDPQKYAAPGAFKEQVHNRALREGMTEMLAYDPALDKPDVPIDQQIVRDRGRTRDIALRYKGVHSQYNYMNSLGNLIQNRNEFFAHTADGPSDAVRRAKYFNRVLNDGLGNMKLFANDYAKLAASSGPDVEKRKLQYLERTLGLALDDNGRPNMDAVALRKVMKIADISMRIERDKTNPPSGFTGFDDNRGQYFADYEMQARRNLERLGTTANMSGAEIAKAVAGEQHRLFEVDQKVVLMEAVLAGLRHSVGRDLTPEGALRNRVRFDPATQKFVIDDIEASKKIAGERATEVALFFEMVNTLSDDDPTLLETKRDIKKRAMAMAPNEDVRSFYDALDRIDAAAIDNFIKGSDGNVIQKSMDELMEKQQNRALELAVDRKNKLVEYVRGKGVRVDAATVPLDAVRRAIVEKRGWKLTPPLRAPLVEAVAAMGNNLRGDFREAFYQNASGLMIGSSAINLARAWQNGADATAMAHVVMTEALNYMPDYIQMPATAFDLLIKVKQGDYKGAAWQASLFGAMLKYPQLGHAMLAYNITTGLVDMARTHVVTRMNDDITEQALKSRPHDEMGGRLPEPMRARANHSPDREQSLYNGGAPRTPLFYGAYKSRHDQTVTSDDSPVHLLNGTVPQDSDKDENLADSATFEFGALITETLTEKKLRPGSKEWAVEATKLKAKYGFDIPFYRRIAKVYQEKYSKVQWYVNWPNAYNEEYLKECRRDVFDWYVEQPLGYKNDLAGEYAGVFYKDETPRMQEMIARQCTLVMGAMKETELRATKTDSSNRHAFREAMKIGFNAERALMAAGVAVQQKIQSDELLALKAMEEKALALATKYTPQLTMSFPFTYASEEYPPILEFETRNLPSKVAGSDSVVVTEQVMAWAEGAPSGWKPGKSYEKRFQPDSTGFTELRPITFNMKFTGKLVGAGKKEIASSTLELPVVAYAPSFSGTVTVQVYALGPKGDSSTYANASVTIGNQTQLSGSIYGTATFTRLKAGSYSAKVTPAKGDERHGPGSGSAAIVDLLLAADKNGKESATIVVKLPYIPEKIVAAVDSSKTNGTKPNVVGGKPGDKTNAGSDSAAVKDSIAAAAITKASDAVKALAPIATKAENAKNAAIAACKYADAVVAQQELVAAARSFVATSFPRGTPPEIAKMVAGYDADLVALRKSLAAEELAKDKLREARGFVMAKKGEPALTSLEGALNLSDVPPCLHNQIQALYNEIKADIEKRMLVIDKAVDYANNKCDFTTARELGEQIEKEDATLSWVVNQLPRIRELEKRQKNAKVMLQQAEAKKVQYYAQGDQKLIEDAIKLAGQALDEAPSCEKEAYRSALNAFAVPAPNTNTNAGTGAGTPPTGTPKIEQSLVLLLDVSGSMGSGGKMESAKEAASGAVRALSPTTEVALITYDGGCAGGWRVVHDFTTTRKSVLDAIAALSPGGGTPTAPAIGFANAYLQKNARSKSGQIVLMTDGQNDCGSMVDAGSGVRQGTIPVRIDAVGFGLDTASKATKDLGDLVRAAGSGTTYSANSSAELISAFRRAFITTQVKPIDPMVTGAAGTKLSELFAAAIAYLKQNDIRGAIGQFKTAADQFPASPAAAFNASLAYEAGGQPLQALNYANKYLQMAPNAFDAGSVRERVTQLQAEQAANPRAIYAPNDCSALYRWAQRETRLVGNDATRKAKVYDIMTTAQRGDCGAAEKGLEGYTTTYGKRP